MSQPTGRPAADADARDRGLRRVRAATGWATFVAAAGAVTLAAGYAGAAPGPSTSNLSLNPQASPGQTGPGAATGPAAAPGASRPSSSPAAALQPPAQAPLPTKAPPQVVSGAS